MAIEYAQWLRTENKVPEALGFFNWITKEVPVARVSATAYYWLMLNNWKAGRQIEARSSANSLRACYAGTPALLDEWQYDCAAILIIGIDIKMAHVEYSDDFVSKTREKIDQDMEKI